MAENSTEQPSEDSLRKAMELAWRDHHHARDQTWKTVQIVVGLGGGLLAIDIANKSIFFTIIAAIIVMLAAAVGVGITWNHRLLERRKFIHIMNCEERLGLHQDDIFPLHPDDENYRGPPSKFDAKSSRVRDGAVKIPRAFRALDIFNPLKHNTALFILRIHLSVIMFCVIIIIFRSTAS
jgi:disulfide bond formation protein DsbB